MRIGEARRLQVGREERRGEDLGWEDDCGPDCGCWRNDLVDCEFEEDDEDGLALLGVAALVASLHRPFAGLFSTSPASP